MEYTSIEEIGARIYSEFKIDVDEFFVRQHALDAVNEMGLISVEDVLVRATIKDYKVRLPQNVGIITRINWVVAGDAKASTTVTLSIQNIWFPPQVVFTPIPNANIEIALLDEEAPVNVIPQIKGPYVPFKWDKGVFSFNETDREVVIYMERLRTDKDTGLPLIPRECLAACAFYCAEVYYRPLLVLGKIPPFVWEKIERWTDRNFAIAQNRYGFKRLDQNKMDEIRDIAVSMDRKAYGINS